MRILFCDDEDIFLDNIMEQTADVLQSLNAEAELVGCSKGSELAEELNKKHGDAVFLDIDMAEMSGFDAAEIVSRLPDPPEIIFLTSMDHLVYDSFAYRPFWFLRKSELNRLPEVIEKLLKSVKERQEFYYFESRGRKMSVPLKDILYFESQGHNVTLHMEKNSFVYKARIGKIEEALGRHGLIRCHVGFLVNCSWIGEVKRGMLHLRSGQEISVSRNRQKETEQKFMAYMRSVRL